MYVQDFEALTPNLLARTIETVEGGGLVVLLLQSLASLTSLCTMVMVCAFGSFVVCLTSYLEFTLHDWFCFRIRMCMIDSELSHTLKLLDVSMNVFCYH